MNVAIIVADQKVKDQIKRLMSFMCGDGVKITSADQADLLISDRATQLLEFLNADKYACQILYAKGHTPLPEETDGGRVKRLRIFAFGDADHLFAYPDIRSLVAFVGAVSFPREPSG